MLPGRGETAGTRAAGSGERRDRVSHQGTPRHRLHIQARDDTGSCLLLAAEGGKARTPCARRIVAASGDGDRGEQPAGRAGLSLCAGRQHSGSDRGLASGRQICAPPISHQGGRGPSSRGPFADIQSCPLHQRRYEAEIALQSNLAMAYTANAGWSDPNVYEPYSRALKLCANYGTIREKATVLWGITIAELVNCELTKALEHAEDFVQRAEEWRDDEAVLMAHTAALIANFFIGRLEQAHELAASDQRALQSPRARQARPDLSARSTDRGARLFGSYRMAVGAANPGRECCDAARQLANEIGHPFMLAFASILGVSDHWYEGDLAANLASVERGMKIADDYGYPMYRVIGPLWATCRAGGTRPCAGRARTTVRPARQTAGRESMHSDASLPNSARRRNSGGSGRSIGRGVRCFGRVSGEANRRTLGCSRDLSDPRLAALSRTRARRPGRHALVQTIAGIGKEARGSRLGIADDDQHRAPAQRRRTSGRAEARDLLVSTRAKFPSAETSRDLREADDLVASLMM